MDPRLVEIIAAAVPQDLPVTTITPAIAEHLNQAGRPAELIAFDDAPPGSAQALALIGDELSDAGEHAEQMLARAAEVLVPGGLLVCSARNRVHAAAAGVPLEGRGFSAGELAHALGHRGLTVEWLCGPGAAAAVAGNPAGALDLELDRQAGLLDAAARTVAVGRTARSHHAASTSFFASLPRKIVAAAVVCRNEAGDLLLIHDIYKNHWVVPGGVVDADEAPHDAAVREAWEEAGVRIALGAVLGLFSAPWPDRLIVMYEATPVSADPPAPVHTHEADAAEWVALPEALRRLDPVVAFQVRRCLDAPHRSHGQPMS